MLPAALLLSALLAACSDGDSEPGFGSPGSGLGNATVGNDAATGFDAAAAIGGGPSGAAGGAGAGGAAGGPGVPGGGPSSDAGPASSTAGGLPCAVQKIIKERCGTCHSQPPSFSAPMALTTYAQFQAAGTSDKTKKVYQLVKTRINATTASIRMPPTTSQALSTGELATLNAWLDQNAPASNETCTAVSAPDAGADGGDTMVDTTGLDCYKFVAHAKGSKTAKFKVGQVTDSYYAFGFSAPWQGTVYGEVFRPVIDNPRAIHHWLLYEEPNTDGSVETTIGQHGQGKLLAGWAPGGPTYDFRKYGDVGFELPASTYTLELHYNSADANAEDGSGVELCVQKNKPQNVAGMSWLGYDHGAVLAATTGICAPADEWTGTCVPQSKEPIHILFVTPHLHQSGTHLKSIINGPNGSRVLLDKPFDFNYQITYSTPEVIMPGETITTTCNFSKPQCFGQATEAEMCYLFTYAYPKGALQDNADWGKLAHGEGTCLGQSTVGIF